MIIVKLAAVTKLTTSVSFADCIDDAPKSTGPPTVFAPSDNVFSALPANAVESLLKPENKDKPTAILTYQVIAEKMRSFAGRYCRNDLSQLSHFSATDPHGMSVS